jgi:hypothetical protein
MPRALAILVLAVSTASAKSKIPKVITLPGDGPVIPVSVENGPAVGKAVEMEKPKDLRDSLNALQRESTERAFAIDPSKQWRCAASYRDSGGVLHFVKGLRFIKLENAARSAIHDCRTAAGKRQALSCTIPKLGCRFGLPPRAPKKRIN